MARLSDTATPNDGARMGLTRNEYEMARGLVEQRPRTLAELGLGSQDELDWSAPDQLPGVGIPVTDSSGVSLSMGKRMMDNAALIEFVAHPTRSGLARKATFAPNYMSAWLELERRVRDFERRADRDLRASDDRLRHTEKSSAVNALELKPNVFGAANKIFISYSHDDDRWRKRVCKQLEVLEREGLVQLWDDQKIHAGEDWKSRLYQELGEARIAVLLISDSFLTSDFILDTEVRTLFERCEAAGTVIYPLLIKPCAVEEVSWLAKKQIRPTGPKLKAVASFRGAQRDEVIAAVAREIAGIARARVGLRRASPESSLGID